MNIPIPTTQAEHLADVAALARFRHVTSEELLELHMLVIAHAKPEVQCFTCATISNTLRRLCWAFTSQAYRMYRRRMLDWQHIVRAHLDGYVENALNVVNVTTADGPQFHLSRTYGDWLDELHDIIADAEDW